MSVASAPTVKVIQGLYTNIDTVALYEDVTLEELMSPTEYYEVLLDNTPIRPFIDIDGETAKEMPRSQFDKLIADIEERFCACEEVMKQYELEDLIGVRNASHYEALSIDKATNEKKITHKISFTLIFDKKIESCKACREYAITQILPKLNELLEGVIQVSAKKLKENYILIQQYIARMAR
jgi:hypothetical protein